ncbi:MAG: TIGR02281 family clan AA aspartic protease [Pseudomonadales bacterium]|jgi:aspartyl protease family protein|nr:TIGR02281 family clan AA aspartic protease [Pseudomonadales bacterium]
MKQNHPPSIEDGVQRMGRGMLALFWLIVLGAGTLLFSGVADRKENPNGAPTGTLEDRVAEVRLARNSRGHYVADGTIDGVPARMLLDTGATSIVVPEDLADRIGLQRGRRIPVTTANGPAEVWTTRIDRLALGTLEFTDIEAAIAPNLEGAVLLGMSALGAVEMTQRNGELLIRQYR